MLHAEARWKYRTQKSPSAHHRTTLSGYIFATKAYIDNRNSNISPASPHNMVNFDPVTDLLASLGYPCKFQQFSRLGSVTAGRSGSGRQPNFAALKRGCHLYSAGRPSRWALAHILVFVEIVRLTV